MGEVVLAFELAAPNFECLCRTGIMHGSSLGRRREIKMLWKAMKQTVSLVTISWLSVSILAQRYGQEALWKSFSRVIELPEVETGKNTRT